MKKLGIVCGSLSRGGAERVAVYLAQYMKQKGIEVVLLTATKSEQEYIVPDGVKRIVLASNSNKLVSMITKIKALRLAIRMNSIDTVLIMGVPLCIYAIPGSFHTHAKIIVSERNDPKHFAGKKIVKIISRQLIRLADGYVFQTMDAREFYREKIGDKGVVIPNPLLEEDMPEPYTGEREKVIVTAGRLNPQKNQKMLIYAFSKIAPKFPEYKLMIYGEGELRQVLETTIKKLGLQEQVFLPGNVTNLHERIKKAALFVLSSDFEGMPNALIEAMALGLPCVSTNCPCGGPRAIIKDGVNGVLIPVNSVKSLQDVITNLLEKASDTEVLGQEASKIRTLLSLENIGERWIDYLMSF